MLNIEDIRGRTDPQLQFRFRVSEIILAPEVRIYSNYIESYSYSYDDITMDPVPFKHGFLKYAGNNITPPFSLDLYEDQFSSTQYALQYWRSLIKRPDGTYSYPSEYKRDIVVHTYVGDVDDSPAGIITARGAFPTNSNPIRMSYSESGRVIISQAFECDSIDIIVPFIVPQ